MLIAVNGPTTLSIRRSGKYVEYYQPCVVSLLRMEKEMFALKAINISP